MKILKKQFALLAFVLAIGAAFAFNDISAVWYPLDEDGNIINTPLSAPPSECEEGDIYCTVRMDDSEFTGTPPIENVENPDPNDYIKEVLYKPF